MRLRFPCVAETRLGTGKTTSLKLIPPMLILPQAPQLQLVPAGPARMSCYNSGSRCRSGAKVTTCPVMAHTVCRIRHLSTEDASAWFEYATMDHVKKYMSSSAKDINELSARIEAANSKLSAPIIFGIISISDGGLIGTVGFHSVSETNLHAEITYDLHPGYWGRGIATAACTATADWAFSNLGWVRIQATVMQANAASIRVLQKCGFTPEDKLRNFRIAHGVPHDLLLYSRII